MTWLVLCVYGYVHTYPPSLTKTLPIHLITDSRRRDTGISGVYAVRLLAAAACYLQAIPARTAWTPATCIGWPLFFFLVNAPLSLSVWTSHHTFFTNLICCSLFFFLPIFFFSLSLCLRVCLSLSLSLSPLFAKCVVHDLLFLVFSQLLPRRLDWQGNEHPRTYEDLVTYIYIYIYILYYIYINYNYYCFEWRFKVSGRRRRVVVSWQGTETTLALVYGLCSPLLGPLATLAVRRPAPTHPL